MQSERVGRYRLLQLIGTGGMGQVHRCADEQGRLHAIKLLRDDKAGDPELALRFEREIEVLRQLEHPHIVHLLDEGTCDGRRFYIMSLLEQGSLADLLESSGTLAVGFALRIARQLLAALGHAHARRHVHRDIKPSNVRFDLAGNALLIDFGLARNLDEDTQITADGTMLGTLAYMAPEQVRGETATTASDIYQVGVVLHEMLCGELPFTGSDVLRALATGHALTYRGVRAANPQVPPAVEEALARLLAHDPLARPRSAEEAAALVLAARPPTGTTGPQPVLSAPQPAARAARAAQFAWRERAGEAAGRAAAWVAGSQPVRTALACSVAAAVVIVVGLRFELPPEVLPALAACQLDAQIESTDVVIRAGEPCHAFLELAAPGERGTLLFNRKAATKIAFRGLPVLPGRTYQARVWLSRGPQFPGDAVGPAAVRTFRAPAPPLPAPPPAFTATAPPDTATARNAREAARLVSELKPRAPAFTAPETPTTRENFAARLAMLEEAQVRIAREIAAGELRFPEDELDQLRRLYKLDATLACERLDIDLAFLASAAD